MNPLTSRGSNCRKSSDVMTDLRFLDHATDPTLIPFIYDRCDQWCMYCPATSHCLAYRCRGNGKQDIYRDLADRLYESMTFLKRLMNAEGRETPEIDAMLSNDPRAQTTFVEVNDPIERMGRRYLSLSNAYLTTRPDFPFDMHPRPSGPTPFEVFAWYHALVPAKIYRALVSAQQAARGDDDRRDDAACSAKIALIGIDRSLEALGAISSDDDDPRLELMLAHLRRLRRELDGRFPEARSFVRRGLDAG